LNPNSAADRIIRKRHLNLVKDRRSVHIVHNALINYLQNLNIAITPALLNFIDSAVQAGYQNAPMPEPPNMDVPNIKNKAAVWDPPPGSDVSKVIDWFLLYEKVLSTSPRTITVLTHSNATEAADLRMHNPITNAVVFKPEDERVFFEVIHTLKTANSEKLQKIDTETQ
jgi:hypothetical protein